jgi:ABC-type amino acid transport system permease subunit
MGSHPLNLTLRFLLEIAALAAAGYWGWTQNEGAIRWLLVIGLPLLLAILWGTFAVPDDPSRSGQAPVPTPGYLRLLLELAIFTAASIALFASQRYTAGWLLAGITLFHYVISYDRIAWLLKN